MLLLALIAVFPLVVVAQGDAVAAINSAKEQLATCLQAVQDAEGAGANVSSLTVVLNEAGALLSRAEFAYSANDFSAARSFAVQSRERLDNCVSEANALQHTAAQQQSNDFMINVVGSIGGAFAVLGVSAVIWFSLKRRTDQSGARTSELSTV